jgi:thymidylate synthase
MKYEELVFKIMKHGYQHNNPREETIALFGETLRYDLSEGFPAITSKRLFFNSVVEELCWFISGDTNPNNLKSEIWMKDHIKYVQRLTGLDDVTDILKDYDAGKIYGYQWRKGFGVDQLSNVIKLLKDNPESRRIILTAWNPKDIEENDLALPPCHVSYQFNVREGKLDCLMYQRSADVALGLPFNIASTSLLVHILARIVKLDVGIITITIGNAHIYKSHLAGMTELLTRPDIALPELEFDLITENLDDFQLNKNSFRLLNYNPHPPIRFEMLA